jgi:hypothetical protein
MNQKKMATFCGFLAFASCLVLLSAYQATAKKQNAADRLVNMLVPVARKSSPKSFLKMADSKSIRLPDSFNGKNISTAKFDQNHNIYFTSFMRGQNKVLFKVDANSTNFREISFPSLQDKVLDDFYVHRLGRLYCSFNERGAGTIAIIDTANDAVSRFDTGDFHPTAITVDANNSIWALGSTPDDIQVRVYDLKGNLVRIPAGGISSADVGLAKLITGDDGVSLISHFFHSVVYRFNGQQLSRAERLPFHNVTTMDQRSLRPMPLDPSPLIKGVTQVNDRKIWYGNFRKSITSYTNGFIGVTDLANEAITECIELPVAYRSVIGVDLQGRLYVLIRESNALFFKILSLEVDETAPLTLASE